jgi:hypothetical protein
MSATHAVVLEPSTYADQQSCPSQATIQTLAHDLRQPLSTIEAIAYYLEMTLPPELLEARRHLMRLQKLVEDSNAILTGAVHASSQR